MFLYAKQAVREALAIQIKTERPAAREEDRSALTKLTEMKYMCNDNSNLLFNIY